MDRLAITVISCIILIAITVRIFQLTLAPQLLEGHEQMKSELRSWGYSVD